MFVSDLKHRNASLEEKLHLLNNLNRARIELSFRAPYLNLLKGFGDPHKKLPPVIHVAGTNGKGSIVATLRAILEAQGYKVHAYTSPHLCAFNERIVLAGKEIDDETLESLIDRALEINGGADSTFFEITTAIAFEAFSRVPADILLLEVGLGGRLDCTNVIENPLVTVMSSIGLDHVEFLGKTLRKITGEKAGIMKPGVPCVIAKQDDPEIMEVFETKATELNVPLFRAGAEWVSDAKGDHFRFAGKFGDCFVEKILPLPGLKGSHQIENAGAALGALEIIAGQFPVSGEAIEKGLRNICWPARLQDITADFSGIIPPGWEIWLDGGHNEPAARILSTQAEEWSKDGKPLHLLLGMMNHKDPASFIAPLAPYIKSLSLVDIPDEPKALKAEAIARKLKAVAYADFTDAIRALAAKAKGQERILIAGSLYLAGHVLKTAAMQAHNRREETRAHAA